MISIFDDLFNDMPGVAMYRHQVHDDLPGRQFNMLVDRWSEEDREQYT